VDLSEVAPERYLVNYRYGKRGGNLREGAETGSAVPLAEAQKAFDRLVRSELTKRMNGCTRFYLAAAFAPFLQFTPPISSLMLEWIRRKYYVEKVKLFLTVTADRSDLPIQ
jgi:hypothetical protein